MIQAHTLNARGSRDAQSKWFASPVIFQKGTIAEIRQHIPSFERRDFGLTQTNNLSSRHSDRLDAIIRLPYRDDPDQVPIGTVSKDYVLIPHETVLSVAQKALEDARIPLSDVTAELRLTEFGERMSLSFYLPKEHQFDPGDGNPMALRLECFNSVDGSSRFRAFVSWLRLVCSNGLMIGVTRSDIRRRHVGDLRIEDVGSVLAVGMKEALRERESLKRWMKTGIGMNQLEPWVLNNVQKAWGFKAATRTFHIARTGSDVEIVGQYKNQSPTTIAVRLGGRVPGAPPECMNLFDVSQILAWLAQERRDLQEQLEWREEIPGLLKPLMN